MLSNKIIAITRDSIHSHEFIKLMQNEDAIPFMLPTIKIIKRNNVLENIMDSFITFKPDFTIFMSVNAVTLLFDTAKQIYKYDQLHNHVSNTIVIAVGPKTLTALKKEHIFVSHMPSKYSSVGIGEIFTKINANGKKAFIPRSSAATSFLIDLLQKIGLHVKENYVYDANTFHDATLWKKFYALLHNDKLNGIIFTSSSSVRSFLTIMQLYCDSSVLFKYFKKIKIVSIGPFTSYELTKFNIKHTISDVYTVAGAFDTMKKLF